MNGDTLVDLGDGKPIKWSEATGDGGRYMSREVFDRGYQYLDGIAKQLDTREQALMNRVVAAQRGQTPGGQQLPAADPFADLEDVAVVDGKTLANLARKMAREGFGKMAETIATLSQKLTAMEKGQQQANQSTAALTDRDYQQRLDGAIGDVLTKLEVPNLPEGVKLNVSSPFLKELALDLWTSHDPESWRKGEYESMLSDRIQKAVAFVRDIDKQAVGASEERRKRLYSNPRKGGARPSGEPGYRHQTGSDLAQVLFHGAGNQRT